MKCSCGFELQPKTEVCPACGRSVRAMLEERDEAAVTAADWVQQAKDWSRQFASQDDVRERFEVAARNMDVDEAVLFAGELLTESDGKMLAGILFEEVRRFLADEYPSNSAMGSYDDLINLARKWLELLQDESGARAALRSAEEQVIGNEMIFEAYREWFNDDASALSMLEKDHDRDLYDEHGPPQLEWFLRLTNMALTLPREVQGRDEFIKKCLNTVSTTTDFDWCDKDIETLLRFVREVCRELDDKSLARRLLQQAEELVSNMRQETKSSLVDEIAAVRDDCGLAPLSRDEILAQLASAGTREVLSGEIIDADEELADRIAGFLFGTMDDLSMDIFNEKTTATIRMEFQGDGVRLSVPQVADQSDHPGVLPYADLSDAELTALHGLARAK